jgi:hypothetical protein
VKGLGGKMAWWKYNETNMNFDYSKDEGVTFTRPRLHASIITDGVLDPARIPTVAGSNNFPTGLTVGPTPATYNNPAGTIRLSNLSAIWGRNAANTADISILTSAYSDDKIYMGAGGGNDAGLVLRSSQRVSTQVPAGTDKLVIDTSNATLYATLSTTGDIALPVGKIIRWGNDSYLYGGPNLYAYIKPGSGFLVHDNTTDAPWLDVYSDRVFVASGGVQFPQTPKPRADYTTLDDYREGSWNPILTGESGGSGPTYSIQSGEYIKIGRLVFITLYLALATKGSMTGNILLAGLPFITTSSNASYGGSFVAGYFNNFAVSVGGLWANCIPSSTSAYLRIMRNPNIGMSTPLLADIANNFLFMMSGCYLAAN